MKKIRLFLVVLALFFMIGMQTGCALKDGAVRAYPQGDPNIAMEKYNQLLVEWAYDKAFPNDMYGDFPEFYGGAYIGDHGNLVILLTDRNSQNEAYFEELIGLDNVVFETVKYSYKTLIAESDAAVAAKDKVNEAYFDAISALGISVVDNAINVYVNMDVVDANDLDVQQIIADLTDYPNVQIIETQGYDEPA